jgi:hypothetical protein
MIIAPRNDGIIVSVDGKLHILPQTPIQMMHMAARFQQAAIEMLTQGQREGASAQSIVPPYSSPDDTNGSAPSD